MPIYQFRCTECAAESEILCRFSETENRQCSECEGKLSRIIPSIGFSAVDHGYQMGVVLSSGERVAGHFGQTAPKKKRWL